jgi:carbamoyltransferase
MTGEKAVCLSGGVAFNSVANGKVVSHTPFRQVFIPPTPDDSGTSLGAALYIHHQIHGQPRTEPMKANYFGPGYTNDEIERALGRFEIASHRLENAPKTAAQLLAAGKIIGWFQGRVEFGDRALGNRSILADPRNPAMKDKVNECIKYREKFRPFAPSMLSEYLNDFFVDATPTPYMEKVFSIRPEKRSLIPAVTHVDGSGRLQTVTRCQNPLFYELIHQFQQLTGVPVVLNTSFNLKGEPVVCSPQDAIRTFFTSGLDALIMGDFLLEKSFLAGA